MHNLEWQFGNHLYYRLTLLRRKENEGPSLKVVISSIEMTPLNSKVDRHSSLCFTLTYTLRPTRKLLYSLRFNNHHKLVTLLILLSPPAEIYNLLIVMKSQNHHFSNYQANIIHVLTPVLQIHHTLILTELPFPSFDTEKLSIKKVGNKKQTNMLIEISIHQFHNVSIC